MTEKQQLCVWAGISFVPIFGIVFACIGWLPPPSPSMPAAEVGQMFAEDRDVRPDDVLGEQ